jgi:hypothetical protein
LDTGDTRHVLQIRGDQNTTLGQGMRSDGGVEVFDSLAPARKGGFDPSERLADLV